MQRPILTLTWYAYTQPTKTDAHRGFQSVLSFLQIEELLRASDCFSHWSNLPAMRRSNFSW